MGKKKILFMVNSLYGGGAEKVFQTLLKNLCRNKYDITVCSVNQCEVNFTYYPPNIKYIYIFERIDSNSSILSKVKIKIKNKIKLWLYEKFQPSLLYKICIREKYDVEVAFIEGYATKMISGSSNMESKKIAWVHIDLEQNPWTEIAYNNLKEEIDCYKKYNQILCVSGEVAEAFQRRMKISDTVSVQYNPVDDQEINKKAQMDVIRYSPNIKNFVTIGRLVEQKGYDRLLHVVNKLKDDYSFCIRILGEGSDKEQLETYIKENKLEDYVKLLGFQNNPYPFMKAADAFICSSRSEGFSTAATEALILQKPIFTTDCAGMKELFGGYNCGIICENSEKSLMKMLKKVLDKKSFDEYTRDIKERKEYFLLKKRMCEIEEMIDE